MRQCFSIFLAVSQWEWEKVQTTTNRTYKYSRPLCGKTDFCWTVKCIQFHGIFATAYQPFRDNMRTSSGQSPSCIDTTICFVLFAIVDTMRLYGIQSPDPVAFTIFSGIIWPLGIMLYAPTKGRHTGSGWSHDHESKSARQKLRTVQSEHWPVMNSWRARFVSPTCCLPHWVHVIR